MRMYLLKDSFDASNAGARGFFFEDFEAFAVFKQLQRVVNVRTAANFKTKRSLVS